MVQADCLFFQERLIQIWSRLLVVEKINLDDNFFSLGGHSLLAIELLSEVENTFNITLSMKDIVEYPTINELSQLMSEYSQNNNIEITPDTFYDLNVFPLSINQKQLWYLFALYPKSLTQNISTALKIKRKLDITIVNKVLSYMLLKHPSLRTRFIVKDNVPLQEVLPEEEISLVMTEATNKNISDLLDEEMNYVFDLSNGSLIRLKLFKIHDEEYVFFFMVHHIVWDGISNTIFFHDFFSLYNSFENEEVVKDIALKTTYRDYVFKQLEQQTSSHFKQEQTAWMEYLEGDLPVLDLTVDYERRNIINNESDTLMFDLESDLLLSLESYARRNRITLYSLFISAYYFLLYLKTNKDEFVIGTPVHGRNDKDFRHLIGLFINTLPIRAKLELNKSFKENITLITKSLSRAFAHSNTPLDLILKNCSIPFHPGRTPLFQSLFVYLDITKEVDLFEAQKLEIIKNKRKSVHTEIDFYLYKSRFKVETVIEFRKDLYNINSIKKMGLEFIDVLKTVVADDAKSLSSLRLVDTPAPIILKAQLEKYPTLDLSSYDEKNIDLTLIDLFKEQVGLNPEKCAVKGANFSLSYRELDENSNKIANYIKFHSLGRGDNIGISLNRNADLIVTLLGILKSGAAYVPLDPRYPIDRLSYMAAKGRTKLIFTSTSSCNQTLLENSVDVKSVLQSQSNNTFKHEINGADDCYVLFTSGSTGKPKGVVVSHHNVLNFLISMSNNPGMSKEDRLLCVTSVSFDISVLELFLPLIVGGSLYLANELEIICAESLKKIMKDESISILQATPVTWRILLGKNGYINKKLKVLCGGESLHKDLAMTLLESFGEVWNMYGPTETTVWSLIKKLSSDDDKVYIGDPIANTKVYVLDDDYKLQKIGEPGRLFLAGYGVSKGYIDEKKQTDAVFLENPFIENDLMYDTGDFARFDFNGELECLGRADDQVKLRGHRIELGEVEDIILACHGAAQCCVRVEGDELIAYVTLDKQDENIDEKVNEFKIKMKHKLPLYMIPNKILILESMPLTLNGKIDKKKLFQKLAIKSNTSGPRAFKGIGQNYINIQFVVEDIWKSILSVDVLSVDDSFFNLGGHSLLAIEMFDRVNDIFNLDLPLSIIFERDSILSMSAYIEKSMIENKKELLELKTIVQIKSNNQDAGPIFCFHGIGGNVLNYYHLSLCVGNKPFYGVQSLGINGGENMPKTIPEMARGYLDEIKKVQPLGPYLLAGGSMGGMIALEVAHQLKLMGEEVSNVIMFDTFGPGLDLRTYGKVNIGLQTRLIDSVARNYESVVRFFKIGYCKLTNTSVPLIVHYKEIENKNHAALMNYRPQKYDGDITLIRAPKRDRGHYADPYLGWKPFINGDIDIFEIVGDHDKFIESSEFSECFKKIVGQY